MNLELAELYYQSNGVERRYERASLEEQARNVSFIDAAYRRHVRTLQVLLKKGGVLQDGEDFYHAAVIYSRSNESEHLAMAHMLALQAAALGFNGHTGMPSPLFIAACARDKWLISVGLQQDFGTQFERDPESGKMRQLPTNPRVTDAERDKWCVPPLGE